MWSVRKIECPDYAVQEMPNHIFAVFNSKGRIVDTALSAPKAYMRMFNLQDEEKERWDRLSRPAGLSFLGQDSDSVSPTSSFSSGSTI